MNLMASMDETHVIEGDRPTDGSDADLDLLMQASGADEALVISIEEGEDACPVRIARAPRDGTKQTSSCSVVCNDALLAGETAVASLKALYTGRRIRPGTTTSEATPEQLAEYMRLRSRHVHQQTISNKTYLEELSTLRREAPGFLRAYAAEISVAAYLARRYTDPTYKERARRTLTELESLAPDDVRTTLAGLEVELVDPDVDRLRALVHRLERQAADHLHLPRYQARLAEVEGDLARGIAILEKANSERHTFSNLKAQGDLEAKLGRLKDASKHIKQAQKVAPTDLSIMIDLAGIELLAGDPLAAREGYYFLLAHSADPVLSMNLGVTYLLTGDYEQASRCFAEAKEKGYRNPVLTVNMADCALFRGDRATATRLYAEALARLLKAPETNPEVQANIAHCQAQVGEIAAAKEMIQEALRRAPTSPTVALCGAIVLQTSGDSRGSEELRDRARQQGVAEVWLELPFFRG
jgi:Flp pilus assembly protein TadD